MREQCGGNWAALALSWCNWNLAVVPLIEL